MFKLCPPQTRHFPAAAAEREMLNRKAKRFDHLFEALNFRKSRCTILQSVDKACHYSLGNVIASSDLVNIFENQNAHGAFAQKAIERI